MSISIEYVEGQERIDQLWPELFPLFDRSCREAAKGEVEAIDIYQAFLQGKCIIFAELIDGHVSVATAIEFIAFPRYKVANVFALGGKNLRACTDRFWESIIKFLEANDVKSIDAWVSPAMARILERRLGFSLAYLHMRLRIGEQA